MAQSLGQSEMIWVSVFGLCVCESKHASRGVCWHDILENQWAEFRSTLVDGVVEATDELISFF